LPSGPTVVLARPSEPIPEPKYCKLADDDVPELELCAAEDMFIAKVALAEELSESVTNTLSVKSPTTAAIPAIVPVCELIVSPAGRLPDARDQ